MTVGVAWLFAAALAAGAAQAADPSSMWFFGDSLTDEGRAGRTAPVMWPGVVRSDLGVAAGYNYAIGGSYTSNQPSPIFGDESSLGQVNSFLADHHTLGKNPVAGVWTGTNNIWIGSWEGKNPGGIAAGASADVKRGLTLLSGAGIHAIDLLGVYDLSLTNAYELANANTSAVRAAAAVASRDYNASLSTLQVGGATTAFFNIATYLTYLQRNAAQFGFTRILPLAPGEACDAHCEQTSMFADTIHLSSKTQALIGNYVASGNPIYNGYSLAYGALASDVWTASASVASDLQASQGAWSAFSLGLVNQMGAGRGSRSVDPRQPFQAFAYGQIGGGRHDATGPWGDDRFDWTEPNFTGGVSYLIRPDLRLGGAFGFSHSLGSLGGSLTADSVEGALFASFDRPNFYFDAVVSIGGSRLTQTRTGSFGVLASRASAYTGGATLRGAYLLDLGAFRIGLVAQGYLNRTSLGAFAETGDPLYAIGSNSQAASDMTVAYGVEVRANSIGGLLVAPFADLMLERHLFGSPSFAAYFAALPTQTLPTVTISYPSAALRADAGVDFPLGGAWSGRVTGSASLTGVSSYTVNGGVTVAY